uniref:Uncharacterized protein n=2 Tax=Amphimedon queenslandica TaxID=400682 RepID=A0A1X7TS16_AMPQE
MPFSSPPPRGITMAFHLCQRRAFERLFQLRLPHQRMLRLSTSRWMSSDSSESQLGERMMNFEEYRKPGADPGFNFWGGIYEMGGIPAEQGQTYASEVNAIFGETSALTARNVEEMFIEITRKLPPDCLTSLPAGASLLRQTDTPRAKGGCCGGGEKGSS